MTFIEKNLLKNENIIYRTQPHWVIFITPIFFLFLGALSFSYSDYLRHIAYLFFGVGVVTGVMSIINYTCSEFAVTNKRVIAKYGLLSRHTIGVFHDKVESVDAYQSILGRILGYGDIAVTGTGGSKDLFYHIPDPFLFRKRIYALSVEEEK